MQLTVLIDDELMQQARQASPARSEQEILETALRAWLASRRLRLQQARQLVRSYVKPAGSIVDELIQERRQAAANE